MPPPFRPISAPMTPTLLLPLLFVGVLGGGDGGKCASWCLRPFARAWACETEYCAGFAHEYGAGRVCYLGSAHTLQGMRHPMVQKLYSNAIRWFLHKDPEGAKM